MVTRLLEFFVPIISMPKTGCVWPYNLEYPTTKDILLELSGVL